MAVTKSLILFKANEIDFANWLNEFFESRKDNLYEIPPSQNSQGIIVWITECKIKFDNYNKNGNGHMRGWVNVDGEFDFFIDEIASEESGTSASKRVYLPFKLPFILYEFFIFPTTKGIIVKIIGCPEIDFEELITTIFSQWEGEEIVVNQPSKIRSDHRLYSDLQPDPIFESFQKRIDEACSLLQGTDDTERNKIIIIDWWKGIGVDETASRIRTKGFGHLALKTIYNIRSKLAKVYPGIAPPRMNRKKSITKDPRREIMGNM